MTTRYVIGYNMGNVLFALTKVLQYIHKMFCDEKLYLGDVAEMFHFPLTHIGWVK